MTTPTSRTPVWFFDLDNTLHDASHAIFPGIVERMNACLARLLGDGVTPATHEQVEHVRQTYWKRYGATLLGVIRHHGVDAGEFLRETHDLGDLRALVRFERGLDHLLRRLPGKKILLTNAPTAYSREVVRHIGLHRRFVRHIAIEDMWIRGELRPKPSKRMLRRLIARHAGSARRCVLVEDTLDNLRAARQLGMRTAWVTQYLRGADHWRPGRPLKMPKRPGYVDVKVQSVRQLPRRLSRLLPDLQT